MLKIGRVERGASSRVAVLLALSMLAAIGFTPVRATPVSAAPMSGPTSSAWQTVGAAGVDGVFTTGFISAPFGAPVGYREATFGDTSLRGVALGINVPAGLTTSGQYAVPVMTIGCGWEPDLRIELGVTVGPLPGAFVDPEEDYRFKSGSLHVDPTGKVTLLVPEGAALSVNAGVATFSGHVALDGLRFEADSQADCSGPALTIPSPAGRYRSTVFTDIVTHGPEAFSTFPANDLIVDSYPDFELRFERIEPEPADDPMSTDRKVIVLLNGGGFQIGGDAGRDQQRAAAEAWARAGWVAFLVDYPAYPPNDWLETTPFAVQARQAMQDSVTTTLQFWDHLAANATAWGIDMEATAVAGWSASAVTVLQSLADHYEAAGFSSFPSFYLALSGDWFPEDLVIPPAVAPDPPASANVRTSADLWVTMIHFAVDPAIEGQTGQWSERCAAISAANTATQQIGCNEIEFPGNGHNLWLHPPGTSSVYTPPTVAEPCFGVSVVVPDCSVLDEMLLVADRRTPQT